MISPVVVLRSSAGNERDVNGFDSHEFAEGVAGEGRRDQRQAEHDDGEEGEGAAASGEAGIRRDIRVAKSGDTEDGRPQ